jgi:hypothetical protein
MRSFIRVPVFLIAAIAALIPTAAYAAPAIDRFYVASVRVSSNACRNVPMAFHVAGTAGIAEPELDGFVDMFRGSTDVDFADVWDDIGADGWVRTAYWTYCPKSHGVGTSRAVANEMTVYDNATDNEVDVPDVTTYFPARQHSYFRPLSLSRSGSTVTITGQEMYFSVAAGALRPLPKGTSVALRRGAYGTTSTSYLQTVKVGDNGVVRVSLSSATQYAYQLYYPGNSAIWNALSGVVQG